MKWRPTGGTAFGFSVSGEYRDTNRDVVRRVLSFLEDRNVLWRNAYTEDPEPSRLSAEKIRNKLTLEIDNVKEGGPAEASFKTIRKAARAFCSAAGLNSAAYLEDIEYFHSMLIAMRITVARECGVLSQMFNIDLVEEVLNALPEQDLSWIGTFTKVEEFGGR